METSAFNISISDLINLTVGENKVEFVSFLASPFKPREAKWKLPSKHKEANWLF